MKLVVDGQLDHGWTVAIGSAEVEFAINSPRAVARSRANSRAEVAEMSDRISSVILHSASSTPRADELFNLLAWSASRQSSSEHQRTGAVAVKDGLVVSVGANDSLDTLGRVQHWQSVDNRDYASISTLGRRKDRVLRDVLSEMGVEITEARRAHSSVRQLEALIDVDRAIHAEMAALFALARRGEATEGVALHVTHQPCYRCVRTSLALGVSSITFDLLRDSRLTESLERELVYDLAVSQFVGIRWEHLESATQT